MALGKTHDRIGLILSPATPIAAYLITNSTWLGAIALLGHLMGIWLLSPDLDTHSSPYRRWGALRWYWLPYQKLIPHRSIWSHGIVIGNLIRIGWLVAPFILIALYHGVELPWQYWREAIAFTLGCEVASLVHLKLDGII